jgi:hypothetical protein
MRPKQRCPERRGPHRELPRPVQLPGRSRRYERASLFVTFNRPFSGWGEIFGDDVVAAAMIDRLVHHAEIVAINGTQAHIA